MRTTLIKSVSEEIWAVFFTSLFVFIFIIMMTRMIEMRTDLIVTYNVRPDSMLKMILCLLPNVVLFSMPAACLMSVLLTFIRMSGDNEIIALNSSGISLYQILSPVILFSIACLILACFLTFYWVPLGNRSFKSIFDELVTTKVDFEIKEKVFHEPFEGFIIYVNEYSKREKVMKGVFLVDKRDEPVKTIVAEQGRAVIDEKSGMLVIQLVKCDIFTEKGKGFFGNYPITVDLNKIISSMKSGELKPKEMYFSELLAELENSNDMTVRDNLLRWKLYEMFSLPFSIFFICFIGAPLGAQVKAQGRTKGIVISLFIFLSFYVCMIGIKNLCERGVFEPYWGAWVPVLFLLITGMYLTVESAQNRQFRLIDKIISGYR